MFKKILLITFVMFVMLFTIGTTVNADGFGFKRNSNHQTPDIGRYEEVFEGTETYYVGNTNKKEVYLTFDAGYDNGVLNDILDVLEKKKVNAAFFITGDFIKRFPELVLRMYYDGHIVCNHTYSHRNLTSLAKNEILEELNRNEKAYYDLTLECMPKIVRPPSGVFNKETLQILTELGYKTVFWSSAYEDWKVDSQKSIEYTKKVYLENLHPGSIILMHSVSRTNQLVLESLIDDILNQGYEFKSILNLSK